jgi:hypothetical protein
MHLMKAGKYCIVYVCLILCSCKTYYTQQRFPILEKPDRPVIVNVSGDQMAKLDNESKEVISTNFTKLLKYIKQLEVAIDSYNKYASEKNKQLK